VNARAKKRDGGGEEEMEGECGRKRKSRKTLRSE
jgi:hypothetical protein